jgi:hypothetical protein
VNAKANEERAAHVLASAMMLGDGEAAKRHGCSKRSVQRWRKNCNKDKSLAAVVAEKKAVVEEDWVEELTTSIRRAISALGTASDKLDLHDPAAVHALAGALKILHDVASARRVLDARLAREVGKARDAAPKVAAA